MRSTTVSPLATRPASTSDAEARRSVAIIGAPVIWATPRMMAVLPSMRMSAPRRCSSLRCMKRFSKIVSVITPTPSAMVFRAANCACMSVGKAGYGAVVRFTDLGRLPRMSTVIESAETSRWAPASSSFTSTASMVSARVRRAVTRPPVMAPATRKVPASMRSGSTS